MAWSILMSDADISAQTLAYTVPAGKEARLSASFTNRNTSATSTVSLWVAPSGETVGNEHLKESGFTLGLAGTAQAVLERFFVAPTGAKVYVQASSANVTCQVSGDVVSPDTFGVTDGTSSITYGTNWAVISGQASLKKDQNGQVSLDVAIAASGTPGTTVLTLPTGYRPSVNLDGVCGVAAVGGVYYPCYFLIGTGGTVFALVMPTSTAPAIASGTQLYIHVSFFV